MMFRQRNPPSVIIIYPVVIVFSRDKFNVNHLKVPYLVKKATCDISVLYLCFCNCIHEMWITYRKTILFCQVHRHLYLLCTYCCYLERPRGILSMVWRLFLLNRFMSKEGSLFSRCYRATICCRGAPLFILTAQEEKICQIYSPGEVKYGWKSLQTIGMQPVPCVEGTHENRSGTMSLGPSTE